MICAVRFNLANEIYRSAVSSVLCIITQFTLAYLLILGSVSSLLAFLGDRLQNGSPYPIARLSCLSVCPVCNVGVLWSNGCMDQDETWRAGRSRPWPRCVRWEPSSPSPKGHSPTILGPYLLRPNGCMDQDVTWHGPRPRPGNFVLDGDPAPTSPKGGGAPKFSAHVYCGQTAEWMKLVLGMEVGLGTGDFVLDGDPAPPPPTTTKMDRFFFWGGARSPSNTETPGPRPSSIPSDILFHAAI